MKSFLLFFVLCAAIIVYSLVISESVFAQTEQVTLSFGDIPHVFAPDSELIIPVLIDSSQPINAVSLEIVFPQAVFKFIGSRTGASLIEFWRGKPGITTPGTIKVEGGSSRSFSGSSGEIIQLRFQAKGAGHGQLALRNSIVTYADGKGTKALVKTLPFDFEVSPDASVLISENDGSFDNNPPHIEEARFVNNSIDASRLAVFHMVDIESGIREAVMRSRSWLLWSDWAYVANPVALPANVWAFQLRAVDNSGNMAQRTVYDWAEALEKFMIILAGFVLVGLFIFLIVRIRRDGV